nr:ribonuclease E/G [uncultured Sphingorhabdus sp.]
MSLIEIWHDDAPGERRAALVEDGLPVEIYIQRDTQWVLGEHGEGRIERKTPSGAYIAPTSGTELLVRGKTNQPEGSAVTFEIVREAIAEPGRLKPAEAVLTDVLDAQRLDKTALWERRIATMALPTSTRPLGDGLDEALAGASAVGDVLVSFQRTKAGLVFDVDGTGDPFAINSVAATEIARLLRLYQVGAMVMVDFVSMESKRQRADIAALFDAAAAADSRPFERTAINGYGLMQIVRARPRPSVLDQLFGTRIASLADETQALWLLREVSQSTGFGPRRVTAASPVATLLDSSGMQGARARAERLAGAPMVIVADEKLTGYGHVHVAQS